MSFPSGLVRGESPPSSAQQLIHLLDYIAVEYPEFVQDGRIVDQAEYEEQVEFSQMVAREIAALPDNQRRSALTDIARQLADEISARGDGASVAERARRLQRDLTSAYNIRIVPKSPPDIDSARALYATACAGCHGVNGDGRGPLAAGLDPAPTDFTDQVRQSQRSVLGLFNTITLGVDGTPMASFAHLDAQDRWALAFHVSTLSASDAERAAGAAAWRKAAAGSRPVETLDELVSALPAQAGTSGDTARAILAYLRSHPQALAAGQATDPLLVSISRLRETERLYLDGHAQAAYQAAISAYLDGFELAEGRLAAADRARVEQAMTSLRTQIKSNAPADKISASIEALTDDLAALAATSGERTSDMTAGFAASLIIILREGLEAMLVVVAIAAFLIRAGRRDALRYVHFGWISALLAGIATWIVSSAVIEISGAQREVTEGVTALLSSAVLLYAGYWLHDRSHAARWQAFIRGQVTGTLSQGQLWGLALVSFLAVYREVFETVLFMQSLWVQAEGAVRSALIGGSLAGAALLLVAAWAIGKLSMKLPLGLFFSVSAAFLAVLAVVFAGRGVAALQAAGKMPLNPVDFFDGMPALGLYPNIQALALQALIVIAIAIGLLYTKAASRQQ